MVTYSGFGFLLQCSSSFLLLQISARKARMAPALALVVDAWQLFIRIVPLGDRVEAVSRRRRLPPGCLHRIGGVCVGRRRAKVGETTVTGHHRQRQLGLAAGPGKRLAGDGDNRRQDGRRRRRRRRRRVAVPQGDAQADADEDQGKCDSLQ